MRSEPYTAAKEFYEKIITSWTWEKLTPPEKEKFTILFLEELPHIKGAKSARIGLYNLLYKKFLEEECNYHSLDWRRK